MTTGLPVDLQAGPEQLEVSHPLLLPWIIVMPTIPPWEPS